jgi:murein DD-endopeptidase MepM/ murein hydrolase activator NlpD
MTLAVVSLLASLALASSASETGSYRWPLDIPPRISSTFAEFRDGHFHAGIDFGTFRRTGYRVRAVAPGYVWRVKTSPVGYGKALYLRHDDGNYTVYAHLSRFSKEVTDELWHVQQREGSYHVDAFLPPDAVRVQVGDVVAYTGDTGAGGPHLHFELRDSCHCPINPLLHGYHVTDTIPPLVRRVALVPLDAGSRVNGELSRTVVYFRVRNGELVPLKEPPIIWGRIGVEAWAYDHIDSTGNQMGVHSLELELDGKRVFGVRYDRFSYEEFYHLYVHFDRTLRLEWKGEYARLHRLPWDHLPFHAEEGGTGILAAGVPARSGDVSVCPGRHVFVVAARDAAGNTRRAAVPVVVNAPPEVNVDVKLEEGFAAARVTDTSGGVEDVKVYVSGDLRGWGPVSPERAGDEYRFALPQGVASVRVVARDSLGLATVKQASVYQTFAEAEEPTPLSVALEVGNTTLTVDVRSETPTAGDLTTLLQLPGGETAALSLETDDYRHFRGTASLEPAVRGTLRLLCEGMDCSRNLLRGECSLTLQPLTPWQPGTSLSPDSLAGVSVAPGDLHYLVYPFLERRSATAAPELVPLGHAYDLTPRDATVARTVRVFALLPPGESPEGVGLFRNKADGKWSFEGAELDVLEMGEVSAQVRQFGTFALLRDVEAPSVSSVRPYAGQSVGGNPKLEAVVIDRGSGLDYEASHLELDGQRVVTEYVPERSRLVGHLAAPLASDKLGNERAVEHAFRVRS